MEAVTEAREASVEGWMAESMVMVGAEGVVERPLARREVEEKMDTEAGLMAVGKAVAMAGGGATVGMAGAWGARARGAATVARS